MALGHGALQTSVQLRYLRLLPLPIGYVDSDSMQAQRLVVNVVCRAAAALHPSPFSGRMAKAKLYPVIAPLVDRGPDLGTDHIHVLGVHHPEKCRNSSVERSRLQAEKVLELRAPRYNVVSQI